MSDRKDDKLLEDYLKGDSELSRRYREDNAARPSAEVDAAILQAARSAVEQPHRPAARNWYVPLSLAAVVVIGVSVVFRVHDFWGEKPMTESAKEQMMDGGITIEEYRETPSGPAFLNAPAPEKDDSAGEAREQMILQELAAKPEAKETPAPARRILKKEMTIPQAASGSSTLSGDEQFTDQARKAETSVEDKLRAGDITAESSIDKMVESDQPAALGVVSSPMKWLAEIKLLWEAGRKDEAVASFKRFLQDWPDYPHEEIIKQLPADLGPEKYLGPD